MSELISLFDYERAALAKLTDNARGYYSSGATDEITLARNHRAYDEISFRHRVLVDVGEIDTRTTALADKIDLPVVIAPTAFQRMAHDDGELATVAAAGQAGTIMIVSTLSTVKIEEVCAASSGPVWFQLYVYRDRGLTRTLVQRAEQAGVTAIVLTVDAPVLGRREIDMRNGFTLPEHLSCANLEDSNMDEIYKGAHGSGLANHVGKLHDPTLTWDDVAWLRSVTSLPIVLKGIVRADDAQRAAQHGASGIVVSNHGGRQLDTSVATIDVLAEVVAAAGHRCDIFVDGGIRRGTDIVKAIALGAKAVLIGRPVLWGLAVDGQDGVTDVFRILREELENAMALVGANCIATITSDLIARKS